MFRTSRHASGVYVTPAETNCAALQSGCIYPFSQISEIGRLLVSFCVVIGLKWLIHVFLLRLAQGRARILTGLGDYRDVVCVCVCRRVEQGHYVRTNNQLTVSSDTIYSRAEETFRTSIHATPDASDGRHVCSAGSQPTQTVTFRIVVHLAPEEECRERQDQSAAVGLVCHPTVSGTLSRRNPTPAYETQATGGPLPFFTDPTWRGDRRRQAVTRPCKAIPGGRHTPALCIDTWRSISSLPVSGSLRTL